MTALSDDELRQVAAHYATEAVRNAADDTMGHLEALPDALDQLGIDWDPEALSDADSDAIAERLGDLLATATISVCWPDSNVRVLDQPKPGENA